MNKILKMIRLWPPPRWPMIAKAKKIIKEQGIEAFREWTKNLSEEDKVKIAAETIDLLAESSGKSKLEVLIAILKGGPPL
jgi:hypothetical protein